MDDRERGSKAHVLVFPGPGQGHINPMLQFAKRLAFRGIKVTLATTVFISKSMQAEVGSIQIETNSDGYDEGGYDSANSAEEYCERLKDNGSRTLTQLIFKYQDSDYPFTCLLYDPFLPWALDVAKHFDLFGAAFFTQSCAIFAIYYYIRCARLTVPFATQDVQMPGLPSLGISHFPSFVSDKGSHPYFLMMFLDQYSNLDQADWILINSFDKLEAEVLNCLMGHWRIKMIGPTVPSLYLDKHIEGDNGYGLNLWKPNVDACMKWLDARETGSVIYVSFGSVTKLEVEQMEELAWVLGMSNKYFLWVTLEGLSLGVPLVGVPRWTDQPTNAKYVEGVWGVGVRARMDEMGMVKREEIERCIREVMEGLKGKTFEKNSSRWRELAKEAVDVGGSSDKNIEEFVSELVRVKRP
ncbi:hypothetical protein HHK36_013365 [Tetracentron sinense]|uniref:Uncharacterized protein n=1 Tax=Tetracentron sinense TaxID=13715 RepID=A0A834Z8P6_TETSI|nr:hypothetical protein HHK36_013365 [Tetracentron sinense]